MRKHRVAADQFLHTPAPEIERSQGTLAVWPALRIRKAAAQPGGGVACSWASEIRRGALTGQPAPKIQKVRHIQESELYAPWDSEISLGALIELPASRIRRTFWCSRRAADTENHGRLQHTQGGELPAPGAPGIRLVLWPCGRCRGSQGGI